MKFSAALVLVSCLSLATGYRSILQVTPQTNFRPVNITVSSAPFDIIATPITPSAPYSQRAYQCNVIGDSRYPPFASGTFPLTVTVPVGQRVRVIFANGNLNGQTVTQSGEPGVIVQQSGSPIVQQMGGASPIVQNAGSPVVQSNAPPTAQVMQQAATVVQQKPVYSQSPVVQQSSPVVQQSSPVVQQSSPVMQQSSPVVQQSSPVVQQSSPVVQQSSPVVQQSTPAATPAKTNAPTTPAPTPPKTPASPVVQQTSPTTPAPTPPKTPASPVVQQTSPTTPAATPAQTPASPVVQQSSVVQQSPVVQQTPPAQQSSVVQQPGRRLLQDRVPGGPNNGLVEYIALVSANTVSGFVVPNTQFGVPYVEFTASAAAAGQTASFQGVLEVAQVVGGVPLYPFRPNASLSPECQVNVNFKVAAASG